MIMILPQMGQFPLLLFAQMKMSTKAGSAIGMSMPSLLGGTNNGSAILGSVKAESDHSLTDVRASWKLASLSNFPVIGARANTAGAKQSNMESRAGFEESDSLANIRANLRKDLNNVGE